MIPGKQVLYALEDRLRGRKGRKQVEVDAFGRQHNEVIMEPPKAGGDVVLSIDLNLQRECAKPWRARPGPSWSWSP